MHCSSILATNHSMSDSPAISDKPEYLRSSPRDTRTEKRRLLYDTCDAPCIETEEEKPQKEGEHMYEMNVQLNTQQEVNEQGQELRKQQSDNGTTEGPNGISYVCNYCTPIRTFANVAKLRRHSRLHTGKMFKCKACTKQFYDRYALVNHIREVHDGVKCRCPFCDMDYQTKQGLVRHIEEKHGGTGKFRCTTCNKSFSYKHTYTEHIAGHVGVKSHVCNRCSRAFLRMRELSFHKTICGQTAKLTCRICDKVFKCMKYLRGHMRSHAMPNKYQCASCGKGYAHLSSLKTHEKRH